MEVIILAGGLGIRLCSAIGNEIPKCMAPVAGKPFLWYLLDYLKGLNVTRVILSIGHLREVIFKWIEEVKNEFPFEFDYAVEETPLGTGGGIKLALSKCEEPMAFVLNGDTFFDVQLTALAEQLCKHNVTDGSIIGLALKPMTDFERYGTVIKDSNDRIVQFNEKTYCSEGLINGGVYAIFCEDFNKIDLPKKFSFEKEMLEPQCKEGKLIGVELDEYFIDIGIPSDYEKANVDFKKLFA